MSAMLYLPFENGTVSKKKSCQVNLCGVFLFKKILIKCGNHCSFKSNGVQPECPVNYSEAKHSAFPSSHLSLSPLPAHTDTRNRTPCSSHCKLTQPAPLQPAVRICHQFIFCLYSFKGKGRNQGLFLLLGLQQKILSGKKKFCRFLSLQVKEISTVKIIHICCRSILGLSRLKANAKLLFIFAIQMYVKIQGLFSLWS